MQKECSACHVSKPADQFGLDGKSSTGLTSRCLECKRKYDREAKRREYARNPEKIKRRVAKYYRKNIDRMRERGREYHADNREKRNHVRKLWREQNLERDKATKRKYEETHREERRAADRARHAANPEPRRNYQRQWKAKNRDKCNDYHARRRSKKRGVDATYVSRLEIYQRDKGVCYLCGKRVRFDKMHLDHVVPLAENGSHSPENCRVTHAKCNLSKGRKIVHVA